MMNSKNLIIYTFLFSIAYLIVFPIIKSVNFLFSPVLEAIVYALIVLSVHPNIKKSSWVLLPLADSVANLLVVVAVIVVSQAFIENSSVPYQYTDVYIFTIASIIGAIIFCILLNLIVKPEYFSGGIYILAPSMCLFAGIPFFFDSHIIGETTLNKYMVPIHKVVWWLMMSFTLALSSYWYKRNNCEGSSTVKTS